MRATPKLLYIFSSFFFFLFFSLFQQMFQCADSKGMEKILLLPKALDLDRPKRSRTAFAKWQLDALETTFRLNPYLVGEQRTSLARRLALSETQVQIQKSSWIDPTSSIRFKAKHPILYLIKVTVIMITLIVID